MVLSAAQLVRAEVVSWSWVRVPALKQNTKREAESHVEKEIHE